MFSGLKYATVIFSILVTIGFGDERSSYHKEYYKNGKLKSEGWLMNSKKSGYWKFYFENGQVAYQGHYNQGSKESYWYYYYADGVLKKEGHYQQGSAVNWWIYYNQNGQIIHKCQLKRGIKNGYCLKYTNEKLSSAVKYNNGRKVDEWFNFSSFKRDNKLSDLR